MMNFPSTQIFRVALKRTARVRHAFHGGLFTKLGVYPWWLFWERVRQHATRSAPVKIVTNTLFWGRPFYTRGYFLDYYLCGFIAEPIEIALTEYLLRRVHKGEVFFDVGAHFGFFSILVGSALKQKGGGAVVSFEPTPGQQELLQRNVSGLPVQVISKAVSHSSGAQAFGVFSDPYEEASNSLYAPDSQAVSNAHAYASISVETVSLDDYCKSHSCWPSLLKIDVEGAEYDVLAGAQEVIAHRPEIIIELWPVGKNKPHLQAIGMLIQKGYHPYFIKPGGLLSAADQQSMEHVSQTVNIVLKP